MGLRISNRATTSRTNDTSTAKIDMPGMETMKSLMWKSYVQCCAICHGGATPRPSQTSNASFRECSSLCVKARPHEDALLEARLDLDLNPNPKL